jgi:hypothetical protein
MTKCGTADAPADSAPCGWKKEVLNMAALGQSGFASGLPVEEACALAMAGIGNIGVARCTVGADREEPVQSLRRQGRYLYPNI